MMVPHVDFLWIYFAATGVGFAMAPREGDNVTLTAREGDNVTLTCRLDTDMNLQQSVFDWKKGTEEVFFYDRGKTYNNGREGQNPQFNGRVGLPPGGLQAGDASVILSNVREEDGGMYTCFFPLLPLRKWIHLTVVVKPRLRLQMEEAPLSSGWVLLSCVSRGGRPQPSGLEWRNQDQAVIPAEPPATSPDIGDPSVIARYVKVTTPGRYTCTALQDGVHPAVSDDIQVFGNWQLTNPMMMPLLLFLEFCICCFFFFFFFLRRFKRNIESQATVLFTAGSKERLEDGEEKTESSASS